MAGYFDPVRPGDYISQGFGQVGQGLASMGESIGRYEDETRPFAPDIQAKIREMLMNPDKINELMHPDADPIEIARRDRQGLQGVNPQASTPDIGYKDGRPQLQAPGAVSPWGGPQGPSAPQGPSGAFSESQAGMTRKLGNLRADLGYGAPPSFSPDMLRTQPPVQPQSQEPVPYNPSPAVGGRMQQTSAAGSPRPGMQSSLPPRSSGGGSISLNDSDYKYSKRDLEGLNFVQGGIKAREANKAKTDAAKLKADADAWKTRYVQKQLNERFAVSSGLKAEQLDDHMQEVLMEQEGENRRADLRTAMLRRQLDSIEDKEISKLLKTELDDASRNKDALLRDPMSIMTPQGQEQLKRANERLMRAQEDVQDQVTKLGFTPRKRGNGPSEDIGDRRPLAATPEIKETALKGPTPQASPRAAQAKPAIPEGTRKTLNDGRKVVRRGGKWVQE